MKIASIAGVALFMLVSLVIGSRLLWRARKRKLPEALMGVALLSSGFLAFALGTLGKLLLDSDGPREALTILGLTMEYVGCVSMALFAWRVFHRRSLWAMAVATLFAVGATCMLTAEIVTGEMMRYTDQVPIDGPMIPIALGIRGLAPLWLAFECFRFHASLRKRLKLGLAKRIVVHRVALWGGSMAFVALAYAISIAHRSVYGLGIPAHPWAVTCVATCLTCAAFGLGFAFFPPQSYRRKVD